MLSYDLADPLRDGTVRSGDARD